MQYAVEPGEFQIMAGPNSVDLKTAVLMVARPASELAGPLSLQAAQIE